jgi:dienelactone hydrolase
MNQSPKLVGSGPARLAAGLLLAVLPTVSPAGGTVEDIWIEAARNPLGDALRAVLMRPEGASAEQPTPACLVVHGSGGLFRDLTPGEPCGALESRYRKLGELLVAEGVTALLPSSFDSRDERFCEDNSDAFFQFVPPPFHNPGDGEPDRDGRGYKIRRTVIRPLDLLASFDYLCEREDVDCSRLCMVGTSNGGTAMLSYIANELERHLSEYIDIGPAGRREHESSSAFSDRQTALANFPTLPAGLAERLAQRPLPRFVQAIAPGCGQRNLVPAVLPSSASFDPGQHLGDLYYPAPRVELHLDIGTEDGVPDECHAGGFREVQARGYEQLAGLVRSRYLIETHEGAGHDLLGEREQRMHVKLTDLVRCHLFDCVFKDGLESLQQP